MKTDQSAVRKTLFCWFGGANPPGSPLVRYWACVINIQGS